MKKVIFSMCLAALAIGCAKTEVQFEETDLISFAPVAHNATKVALGENAIPTANLIVSANAGIKDAAITSYTEEYFKNVEFTNSDNGIFTANGYFWPNVKYLTFAGITKSAGVNPNTVLMDVDANLITIGDYPQQEITENENDLMWFGQTAPAGKTTSAIEVDMMHACSWIVLRFIGDETASNSDLPWNITKVTIDGLAINADVELNSTASWKNHDYGVGGNPEGFTLTIYDGVNKPLSSNFEPSPTDIIVIPQKPTTLSVTYNYVSQKGATAADNIVIEETATVNLNYDGTSTDGSDWTSWAAGTKYTYNVTIGATPIKIAPSAEPWTPGTTTTPTI